jgi:YidC/Oxa1 family membrane protein insertase
VIPNYGVICILFAFIIRIFTGPLTKQSFLSNQKMQKVQPKMKKIQEKYKDDQAKLSQATMELYKKEGVNPLGGCLPILVQMPLLIALFQVFRKTIEFRGAEFLPFWITDLSQPDIILQFEFLKHIPGISFFFGHGIALLPIIMGVVMFLSMQMTATTSPDPSAKFAMYFMNAFFILLFNTFPSGLNLYYTIYNILNFIQQRQLKQLQT